MVLDDYFISKEQKGFKVDEQSWNEVQVRITMLEKQIKENLAKIED